MQKIVNGIAILSGIVSLSLIGGGVYLFVNKDAVITNNMYCKYFFSLK